MLHLGEKRETQREQIARTFVPRTQKSRTHMVEYDLMEGSWGSWGPLVCSKISQATRKNMRAASRRHLACWCNGSDAILADFWHGGTNFHTGIMNKKNKFAMLALGIWGFSCIDSQAYNDFPLVSLGCSLCPRIPGSDKSSTWRRGSSCASLPGLALLVCRIVEEGTPWVVRERLWTAICLFWLYGVVSNHLSVYGMRDLQRKAELVLPSKISQLETKLYG